MKNTVGNLLSFDSSHCFIDGRWCAPAAQEKHTLTNPSNGEALCDIALCNEEDVDTAVNAAAVSMQGEWGKSTALERSRLLSRMSALVLKNENTLAELEVADVGKPVKQALADARALARYLEYYAGAADKLHGQTLPYLDGYTTYTLREPHGVTAHVVPWNYPMQIIGRSVGAALTMGNAAVLKPAEEACLTALAFADIAREAGLPNGALNVIPGLGPQTGSMLVSHSGVQHVSFTGSVATGVKVQTGAAQNVVPVTLELGGKSPQLVFNDADLDAAVPFLVNAGIQNAGQTCSASSRLLVQRGIYDELVSKLVARYGELRVGPAALDLELGPLISARQKSLVQGFLEQGHDLECVAHGSIIEDAPAAGHYVAPQLFAGVASEHVLAQDEIFGPVQVIIPFDDEEQAVNIANGTDFGLVASVWTANGARQMRLAKQLKCGQVFINNYGAGGGVELPFGGVGKSGHGREKGFEALYGFSTLKTVAAFHG